MGKPISSVVATHCRKQELSGTVYHIRLATLHDDEVMHVRVYQPDHDGRAKLQAFKMCDAEEPLVSMAPEKAMIL